MKYLKLYESMNGDKLKNKFTPIINWDLIEDIKEMSLEYLDYGFKLYVLIYHEFESNPGGDINIYIQTYTHSKLWVKWPDYEFNKLYKLISGPSTYTGVTWKKFELGEDSYFKELVTAFTIRYKLS